jgi:ABC-2 type transport system permease protein
MTPIVTLAFREIVRFYRDRGRVIGSLASPLVFWLVLGSGFGRSFRTPAGAASGYLEYFFPGVVAMILLFTAIFSTITLIEDRNAGFLQAVLVSPVPRSSIVLGKTAGATMLAVIQALLFLILAPAAGIPLSAASILLSTGVFLLVGLGLTALGEWIAWKMDSTHGFHTIMNLVMLPMWLLSGAACPETGASTWLGWLMRVNPMTYGTALIRRAMYVGRPEDFSRMPSVAVSLVVVTVFAGLFVALCTREASRRARA